MPLKFLIIIISIFVMVSAPIPVLAGDNDEIHSLLNQERLNAGQSPLQPLAPLMQAAQAHAKDMRRNNYFSHTGNNGSSHSERIKNQGYTACYTAENIAKGQKTAKAVMTAWMQSDGHRRNILSPKGDYYGIGIAGDIWVMVFAQGC